MADRWSASAEAISTCCDVSVDEVTTFLSGASDNFLRSLETRCRGSQELPWPSLQDALCRAKKDRRSSQRSGVSRKDAWFPIDIGRAFQILTDAIPATNPTNDQPEHIDLTTQPEPSCNGDPPTRSVLQFDGSSFPIQDESFLTLQPGTWLNDEIINGALRLIKEVSTDKVEVIDSCALQGKQRCPRVDFRKAKVLLPMLIRENHWVLGVYEDGTGLLVYDSLPRQTTRKDLSPQARKFLSEVLEMDDIGSLHITITSPLLQVNGDDCGVLSIVAAFHVAMDLTIKPMCIDPHFWRDVLHRLLRSQSRFDEAPMESVELPHLPTEAQLLEHPKAAADTLRALFSGLRQNENESNKRLRSAKLILEIAHRAGEGAGIAGLEDAVTRFQQVAKYCKTEVERLHAEQRILRQLLGPCITNFPETAVKKRGRLGNSMNDALDNRKRRRDGLSDDERSYDNNRIEELPTSPTSPDNHHDSKSQLPINLSSPAYHKDT